MSLRPWATSGCPDVTQENGDVQIFQPQTVPLVSPVPVVAQRCEHGDIFLVDLQVTEPQLSDHKT